MTTTMKQQTSTMKRLINLLLLSAVLCFGRAAAADITVPRLTPPGSPERIDLNGSWQFCDSIGPDRRQEHFPVGGASIEVPGEWVMQGFQVKPGNTAGYSRSFSLPASWKGRRIKLRCNGVYSRAEVFVNRRPAGSHLGGFTPFELDVTDLVTPGQENRIALAVTSESIADSTSNGSFYAVHPLGGITRDICLLALPEVNLSSLHAATTFDSLYTDAVLAADIEVTNEGATVAEGLAVTLELKDADGRTVALDSCTRVLPTLPSGQAVQLCLRSDVRRPRQWDPEHPYLYTLTCRLERKGTVVQTATRRIGFRQIEVRKNQVFVNGHAIKLRGVCRHEIMPLRGRSLTGDIWRKDVELFRQGNVNYIRTSHYPPDEALLDACDELGMFVEVEAPLCWAHQTQVPEHLHTDVLVRQHVEMVHRDRSHPSVLMWSMGNESTKFEEYFREAAETVRRLDPTRPRIFSQWGPDADGGALEVTNHHYPGPTGPDKYRSHPRPVVFDEYCHMNAYNRLELSADPGLRSKWGDLLDEMWSNMYHSRGVLGGAIWVGIDDTFFLPDGRTVGYGTWGVIDGWRREKPEYWGMKKAYSPVKVRLKGNMDAEGRVVFDIENRHLFSNLDECVLEWTADGCSGTLAAALPPGGKGETVLTLPSAARNARYLDLRVVGVRGFETDRYRFQLLPIAEADAAPPATTKERMVCQADDHTLTVRTRQTVFRLNRRNGQLDILRADGDTTTCGPALMLLPLNNEGEGIQMIGRSQTFAPYTPCCTHWVARRIGWKADKNQVVISVEGDYEEAEGGFTYTIRPDGQLETEYCFTVRKEISPRQIGLVFRCPDTYDRLYWQRKGYWNAYPEHHIAALEGTAQAFDPSLPISGIAGPGEEPHHEWAFDQTKNGSNLFRSTKENIRLAQLTDDKGRSITLTSDATQHFRAWVDQEHTYFLVADYTNAGSDTYFAAHAALGYRPLKRGDCVSGKATLCF